MWGPKGVTRKERISKTYCEEIINVGRISARNMTKWIFVEQENEWVSWVTVRCCWGLLQQMVKVLQEIFRNGIIQCKNGVLEKRNKGRNRLEYIERNISWKYLNCVCFCSLLKYTYEDLHNTLKINVISNPKYNSSSPGKYLNEIFTKHHEINLLLMHVTSQKAVQIT